VAEGRVSARDPARDLTAPVVVPVGTVVSVTSVNRLKTRLSDFAPHVEAPIPEHKHEAQTSERTLTPTGPSSPELTDSRD
jgi:hypothetical protein